MDEEPVQEVGWRHWKPNVHQSFAVWFIIILLAEILYLVAIGMAGT